MISISYFEILFLFLLKCDTIKAKKKSVNIYKDNTCKLWKNLDINKKELLTKYFINIIIIKEVEYVLQS